jgi:hypothetical protein
MVVLCKRYRSSRDCYFELNFKNVTVSYYVRYKFNLLFIQSFNSAYWQKNIQFSFVFVGYSALQL